MKRLVLLLAAPALLAGCGAADDLNPDVVARAADKTASAGGARVAFTSQVDGEPVHGTGFMDARGRKGRLKIGLPAQVGGTMQIVFLERVVYIGFPPQLRAQVPGKKAWAKFDLERASRAQGIDVDALQSVAGNDPSTQLEQLRGAGHVEKVGREKVRGVDTTHYKAIIDLHRSAERAPAGKRAAARRSSARLVGLIGQRTVPVEVWIDEQGLLRRNRTVMKVQGQTIRETVELYDFGTREAVKAPPASETADVTDQVGTVQP